MARRTRAWTVDKQNHTCAGKERVVVVDKINGKIKNAPKIFYLFILIFHNQTMATNVKRPVPNRTVLLVCDIQVKFSEAFFFYRKTGEFANNELYRRCNLRFRRGGRDCEQDAQDSQGIGASPAVLIGLH